MFSVIYIFVITLTVCGKCDANKPDPPKCKRDLKSRSYDYKLYPIDEIKNDNDIYLEFYVKAEKDALIIFSPTNDSMKKDQDIYEVVIGGYSNTKSTIRETPGFGEELAAHFENNTLSPEEYRQFWIRISPDGSSIQVGKKGHSSPIMHLSKRKSRYITHYGFATWGNSADVVNWFIPCSEDGKYDLSKCKQNLKSRSYDYKVYPIDEMKNDREIYLDFDVKAEKDALIIFSPTIDPMMKGQDIYEVLIGGYKNTRSTIRETPGTGTELVEYYEENILSPTEYRQFWIRISPDGSSIHVGKKGHSSPIMRLSKRKSRKITHYGFATWTDSNNKVDWFFPCSEDGKYENNPCIPSPCGPNSKCHEEDNRAVCSCQNNYFGSPPRTICRPECNSDSECPQNKTCQELKCQDGCVGKCGKNAECRMNNHEPICSCSHGFTGDPFTYCIKEEDGSIQKLLVPVFVIMLLFAIIIGTVFSCKYKRKMKKRERQIANMTRQVKKIIVQKQIGIDEDFQEIVVHCINPFEVLVLRVNPN